MKNLVIVESPNKVKKIENILGANYKVMATVGHVRDLMLNHEFRMGIDLNTMTPSYKTDKDKLEIVEEIKKEGLKAKNIYLATDPDREGEAIAWHIQQAADLGVEKIKRITFNEITKEAVENALDHYKKIDTKLVNSQEARRMIDRMVGFRLSKLLREKTGAKSAGRVQSVALKIIIEREKERALFKKEEWYTVEIPYSKNLNLKHISDKKVEVKFKTEKEAKLLINKLSDEFKLIEIKKREQKIKRPKPLEMSSYLISMYQAYKFSNAKSSLLIQKLYEKGLVTYPRTDSTRISSASFLKKIEKYIIDNYGTENFLQQEAINQKGKKNTEDAHEAIRPSSIQILSDEVKKSLSAAEFKAYKLIRDHTLKCFMPEGVNEINKLIFDNNKHLFSISVSVKKFLGFRQIDDTKLSASETKDLKLLKIKIDEKLKFSPKEILPLHHETKPQPQYNQASLIKKLKQEGIGRPSTYTPITRILLERVYILSDSGVFQSTELGNTVNEFLQNLFNDVINEEYTSSLNKEINQIALGEVNYQDF